MVSKQTVIRVGSKGQTVHGRHDESDLGGIGGTGEMSVNLLRLVLVQGNETVEDVITRRRIVRSAFIKIRLLVPLAVGAILVELAFIIWEVILHWADWELLLEPIDLV